MERLKLIVFGFALILGVMLSSIAVAQKPVKQPKFNNKEVVSIEFKVYLNDKQIETDSVQFWMINEQKGINAHYDMSSGFTAFISYHQNYTFKVGYRGYNTRTIDINTTAPNKGWVLSCNIYLYSDSKDEYAGKLAYDPKVNQFKLYN